MKYILLIYAMVVFFATPFVMIRLIRQKKDSKLYFMAIISLAIAMLVHPFCVVIALTGNFVGIALVFVTSIEMLVSIAILYYFYQITWRTIWK